MEAATYKLQRISHCSVIEYTYPWRRREAGPGRERFAQVPRTRTAVSGVHGTWEIRERDDPSMDQETGLCDWRP